jgi:hypothetical protein
MVDDFFEDYKEKHLVVGNSSIFKDANLVM